MTGIERLSEVVRELGRFSFCYDLYETLGNIADQIEREQDAMVADSPYDALPPDDRDAIAWVREHGGVERVKQQRYESIPRAAYERKRRALLGHIAECETALGKRREAIARLADENDALRLERAQMRPRLMPEGMEWLLDVWPKWSNGEYCKFGDWWKSDKYGEHEPNQFRKLSIYTPEKLREWGQDDGDHFGYEWDFVRPSDPKYRPDKVEPPAPKVFDADGVEVRVGDTVWDVEYGCEHVVTKVSEGTVFVAFEDESADRYDPASLTHRAPVLAADGRPLREGETVYEVGGTGHAYEVVSIRIGDGNPLTPTVVTCDEGDGMSEHFLPSALTHERPDSWERLEEDAEKFACEYFGRGGKKDTCTGCRSREIDPCTAKDCEFNKTIDLVRRAKALAERGE